MSVTTIGEYDFPSSDVVENFHGNFMVHVLWDVHLMFAAPVSLPLPPAMPFAALTSDVLPQIYGKHPDWARIDWAQARWELDGVPFQPDPGASLGDQGIGHKSLLRFATPGLDGLYGAGF